MKPIDYETGSVRKPHPFDVQIGQNVLRIREKAGLNRHYVATKLNVSTPLIERYESGICRIAGSRLLQLAVALDCQPADFFQGVGQSKGKAVASAILGSIDMRAAHAYQALPSAKQKQAILNLMRAMAQADEE